MKQLTGRILTFGVLMISALCASAQEKSGVEPYSLDVKEFDKLKVVDGINVEYFNDPSQAGKVAFECTPDVASAIIFEPDGKGKLEIKLSSRNTVYRNLPVVRVYSTFLTKVENDGDSLVRVFSPAPCPKLEVKLMGNGRITVENVRSARTELKLSTGKGVIVASGESRDLKISLTGTGEINASALRGTNVECSLWGTGWIRCDAVDNLKVTGAGTGTVTYTGRPVTSVKAMKIKVKHAE